MKNQLTGRRYARALLEIAIEKGSLDSFEEQLKSVADTISSNKELQAVWNGRNINQDTKKKISAGIFKDSIDPELLNLLFVLIDKSRENLIDDVCEQFFLLGKEHKGMVVADVRTEMELDQDKQDRIVAALEKDTGRKIFLNIMLVPDLVGGVRIRIGDDVYEDTVLSRTVQIEDSLKRV